MKDHKKLYKAGKNWVIATVAVASFGVIAMQQPILADSTVSNVENTTTNQNDQLKAAQQTKDQAQVACDQQNQAVNSAAAAVKVAQSNADLADNNLATAKANAASAGATSANIASASANVKEQQAVVDKWDQQLKDSNAQPANPSSEIPSATNAQALDESIEQNRISLPDGYVQAFNDQIAAIGDQNKNVVNENFDWDKSQANINTKVSTLQNIAKDIAKLNPYHHNENDAKVAIKDIYNLDPDVATNLSLWYAGVLNNLVKKYDLKNVDGTLLRDVMHLAVTNYSLETANYINNQVNKNTDEFLMGKLGAYNIELVLVDPQAQKNKDLPTTETGFISNYDARPEFLKAIDGASTPWGETEAVNPKKVTNLDELKEAIWNNVILYNLLDSSFDEDNIDYNRNIIKDIKQFEHSALNGNQNGASIFGPALFMQGVSLSGQNLNGKLSKDVVSQYSFALAVDKAGQITPHWYHVTKD